MAPLLQVDGIVKTFPGVRALDGVSIACRAGEVLAVIGENGAGKSTLMKILAGIERPDAGSIYLEGEKISIASPRRAQQLGIALIHQELNLADNLSVAANIFLGREPRAGWFIKRQEILCGAETALGQIGLGVSPNVLVGELSLGHQQMVEIAKALSARARILIMDEPTSSLSGHEAEALFRVVNDLRSRGVTIIYISHRLAEVKVLADRVIVLRDGRNAGELQRGEIDHDRMVQLMIGRDFASTMRPQPAASRPGNPLLDVNGLRTAAFPRQEVSFDIRAGEIVGMAGLVGAGRTEVLEAVFGIHGRRDGTIRVNGAPVGATTRDGIRAGMALVPEDRKRQGIILEMGVRENLSLAVLRRQAHCGFIDRRRERGTATQLIQRLKVRTPGDRQPAQYLSGGNQQKIVLGKWLALDPRVLLLDEPTRGIDVGSKQEIYALIEQFAAAGVAVLFASSEMEEILRISQRILVMCEGRIAGELAGDAISEEAVMRLATGGG